MAAGAEFLLLQEIRKHAKHQVDTLVNQLADGIPTSYEHYRESVGYLRAWREITEYAEQQNEIFMSK